VFLDECKFSLIVIIMKTWIPKEKRNKVTEKRGIGIVNVRGGLCLE
jgi:hypothetical protein